jgi:hypothetical protein
MQHLHAKRDIIREPILAKKKKMTRNKKKMTYFWEQPLITDISGSHGGEYKDELSSGMLRSVVW